MPEAISGHTEFPQPVTTPTKEIALKDNYAVTQAERDRVQETQDIRKSAEMSEIGSRVNIIV